MAATATPQPPDRLPATVGPCRCRECAELAATPIGLLAAYRFPRPHSREAAELAEARELARRWQAERG